MIKVVCYINDLSESEGQLKDSVCVESVVDDSPFWLAKKTKVMLTFGRHSCLVYGEDLIEAVKNSMNTAN